MAIYTGLVTLVVVIALVIIFTFYLYYREKSFQCQTNPLYYCYTDWQCDSGMNDINGNPIAASDMSCYLKAIAGQASDDCPDFNLCGTATKPCLNLTAGTVLDSYVFTGGYTISSLSNLGATLAAS